MSRLFEALQKSEPEVFSFDFNGIAPAPAEPVQKVELVHKIEVQDTGAIEVEQFPSVRISTPQESRLVALTGKEGLAAEKFRFLAVRLRQMQQSRSLKKLLITSTIPEEGKSMVSANLAITLARKKRQKVLILDGDLRRPMMARHFGLSHLAGLGEWLQSDPGTMRNIYYLEELGLWFMPAGRPPENPLELMQSGRLADLLEQLCKCFDWIVIDSPPVLPLADTSVWSRFADGVLLVAREGKTEKKQLQRGLEDLDQSKLLGLVLNSCSTADHSNYYQRYGAATSQQ
jgi:capsular exopolysaccharide synthesis family protein